MKISRLRFSAPIFLMLTMQSGSAMDLDIDQIIYDIEHGSMRPIEHALKYYPECVHVRKKEDLPKNLPEEGKIKAKLITFLKEKGRSDFGTNLEGIKFLQQKKNDGMEKVKDSEVLKYLEDKGISVNKETFSDEFRECVQYANDYYPEDKTDDLPVPLKRTTEDIVAEYLKNHTIATNPTTAKLCEVIALLNELAKPVPNEQKKAVTTDTEGIKGIFANKEEMDDFVEYMQREKEVSDKIKIEKTEKEKIIDGVDKYVKYVEGNTGKEIPNPIRESLEKLAEDLVKEGKPMDVIESFANIATNAAAIDVTLNFDSFVKFIDYLRDAGVNVSKPGDKERIAYEVNELYAQSGSPKVGDLTKEQAYDLAMYMRNQDGKDTPTVITSDITKTNTVESINGKTITHQNLVDFVKHLNTKEAAAQKGALNVIVETTDAEKVDYAVDAYILSYLPSHSIIGLQVGTDNEKAATKTTLKAIVAYLENPGKDPITSDDVKANVAGLSGSDISNKDLEKLKEYLHDQGKNLAVTIERTDVEKVNDAVTTYMETHSNIPGQTEAVLKEIVSYLRNPGKDSITSDDVKDYLVTKGIIANKNALTLDYQNLNSLKDCLAHEDITLTVGINKTVDEMNTEERIKHEIDGYLKNHEIESMPNKTVADKTALCNVVTYLKSLGSTATVTTDNIYKNTAVTFTYEELDEFVKYLKEKNEIPEGIKVKRTTKENAGEYLKTHNITSLPKTTKEEIETAKAKLSNVVEILNQKANDSPEANVIATTDDVKEEVVFKHEELNEFVTYMQGAEVDEVSDKIKVEMTTAERIGKEVSEYYIPPEGSQATAQTVGNLTKEQAYDLAMYMRNQDGKDTPTVITSDITKTNTVKSINGKTITHQNLVDFVKHLNTEEKAAGKNTLNVEVEKTYNEQLMFDIGEYLSNTTDQETAIADTPETRNALSEVISQYLKDLNTNTVVTTAGIAAAAVAAGVVLNLTYPQLEALVNSFMGKDGVPEGIKVEMTTAERIKKEVSEYYTPPEGSQATAQTVGNLTKEQAYALAMYMRELTDETPITSASVLEALKKADENFPETASLNYENLNAFVEYLNTEEKAAKKGALNVTVEKTDDEKIYYANEAYYPTHQIEGLSEEDAKAALTKIAKYLQTWPPKMKVRSSTIMETLQNDKKIPDTVNLTHDELVDYIDALNTEKFGLDIPVVEEELTLRQQIDALLAPETPETKLDSVADYNSYRLDSLLDKEGDIDATDVKNTWAASITESFMPALSDANSGILKQDPNIHPSIIEAAETETQSRIATTTDGSVPESLSDDINDYLNALYEAKSTESALDSILSTSNTLNALNSTETKSTINNGILSGVKADGDTMTAKVNSVYQDLPEIVEAIRRYAVTYFITQNDVIDKVLTGATYGEGMRAASEYYVPRFFTASEDIAKEYLKSLLLWGFYLKDEKVPGDAINTIITKARTGEVPTGYDAQKTKISTEVDNILKPHYETYFIHDSPADINRRHFLEVTILQELWTNYGEAQYLNTQHVRDKVYASGYPITQIRQSLAADIASIMDSNNSDEYKRNQVYPKLDADMPKAIMNKGNEAVESFKKELYEYFTRHYAKGNGWTKIQNLSRDMIVGYCLTDAWVPFKDVASWIKIYCPDIWTNTVAPSQTDITTQIKNSLTNVGDHKTIKSALKSQFGATTLSALVNDENEWPVENGASEIDNYKYEDATDDNKTKVNILDYTYDKIIGKVRATDAKTAYDVLKTQANEANQTAIDELVTSSLRDTMKTKIVDANVATVDGVESAASQVLSDEIISQKMSISDAVKDKYAKIYRSVNIGENAVALDGVTDKVSVNAAFDRAIFSTMDEYLCPTGVSVSFEDSAVTGFVDAVYGSDADAKTTAVRQATDSWITARGEEFKADEIASLLNLIKEMRDPGDRVKYQIEAYLANHDIASLLQENETDKANLAKVVAQLQKLGENATVMTTDITDVEFTYPELEAFVNYFKGKEGIPSTISAVKTDDQKIDSASDSYLPNHQIEGLSEEVVKAALIEIANHLKSLAAGTTIKSSTVMNALKSTTPPKINSEVNLSHDDLVDYIVALNAENFGLDINVAEEESTLRGEINTLVANYVPSESAGSTDFDDTVFDALIAQKKAGGDAVTEDQVRAVWTNQIKSNLAAAELWEKDSDVESEVSDKVNTALNSRIDTTTDGSVPESLSDDINDYLNALYEAKSTESALDSILSTSNTLNALNSTETKSTINNGILSGVTATGTAMDEKVDNFYADLYNCVDPIRRYALTWRMHPDVVSEYLEYVKDNYSTAWDKVKTSVINQILSESIYSAKAEKYLKIYLFIYFNLNKNKFPDNLNSRDLQLLHDIYNKAKEREQQDPKPSLFSIMDVAAYQEISKYHEEYFIRPEWPTELKRQNKLQLVLWSYRRDLNLLTREDIEARKSYVWKNNNNFEEGLALTGAAGTGQEAYVWADTNWDDPVDFLKTKSIKYIWDGTSSDDKGTDAYNLKHDKYLWASNHNTNLDIIENIKNGEKSKVINLLESYVPLAYTRNDNDKSNFKEEAYYYLESSFRSSGQESIGFYQKYMIERLLADAITPSIELTVSRYAYSDHISGFMNNANIPTKSDITAQIQSSLKNLGSGNTIKSALKSQFSGTVLKPLVNDTYAWYTADGDDEINNYASSDKTKVNMLNYTYDKIIGDVRATDAKTAYDVLKTQADAKLNTAVGELVPAAKVSDTISEIKTSQSGNDVIDAVCSVLEDSQSNADAQNYVARIYRGRNVNGALGVVGNNFKEMIDANITYDTLKYLRNGVTIDNVTNFVINTKNFVNKLDGTEELRLEAISNAIDAGLEGFPAHDIADIINRVIPD